ncbi:MAG: outer membrane beta-barrel protein [Bacteroidales bacterium]|nr:TonB-dependent receptor [Bacteroidales bacterium]
MRRILSLFMFTFLYICTSMAENIVMGHITDRKHKPVMFATVTLLDAKTKIPVKSGESNSTGEFSIDKVNPDEYILSITLMGYKKYETEKFVLASNKIVKNVVLEESTQILKEATVTAKRSFIEQQADKIVINPEASITTDSENVLDILKKAPGVSVDDNNNISLKGKQGIKVLIDDKPTYVSAEQLASMLKGMQGKDIDHIEIIENPSSRYDAEGSSGIINIKTKHNRRTGFNGSVFGGLGYNNKFSENTGFNLNMNFGKLNIYGNYSIYTWAGSNNSVITRKFLTGPDIGTFERTFINCDYNGHSHNYKVGADYFLTKKQVVSVMFRESNGLNLSPLTSKSRFEDSRYQLDSLLKTRTDQKDNWHNYTYNVNYKLDFDTLGQNLMVDADYARFFYHSLSDQFSQFFDAGGNQINADSRIVGNQGSKINILTVKTDYEKPINKIFSLEAGTKISLVTNHANMDFNIDGPTNIVSNTDLEPSDKFIYTENINAAYLSGRGQFGKTSVQLGLRMENTNSKGDSKSLDRIDRNHYTNLFPTFFVQHSINKDNQLGLSYSYRIGRPGYNQLNPFMWMIDLYTYVEGNPFLRPQYSNALGLNYTYKNKLITSIGFNNTNDVFTQIIEQDDISKKIYQMDKNLSKSIDLNGSETVQFDITKWWHLNTTVTGMYKKFASDYEGVPDFSRWSFMGNMIHTFSLPHDIGLEFSGRGQSKQLWGYFVNNGFYSFDIGVKKSLFSKNGTLKLSLGDIFDTNHSNGYAKYGHLDVTSKWNGTTRRLNLSFTYRFGKETFKTRVNRSTASSDEESRSSSSNR